MTAAQTQDTTSITPPTPAMQGARKGKAKAAGTRSANRQIEKVLPKLQNRLILNRYMCTLFGRASLDDFRSSGGGQSGLGLNDVTPGLSMLDGRSNYYHSLQGLENIQSGVASKLADYDDRIKGYVADINKGRTGQEIVLLYFQYMAILFTEIYLERMDDAAGFLSELNALVAAENKQLASTTAVRYEEFTAEDLTKLAFWMATGSGKTLIMNINILQYLEYARRNNISINNILLITPNESLSTQHSVELSKSGFLPQQYSGNAAGQLGGIREKTVTVIEITKLTEKKKGGGVSIDVEAFGPNNLVLVDEGHKGSEGEAWRGLRAKAAQKGFTFEYSATFGQIVNGQSNQARHLALLNEYSHAVLLDYSYRFFHADGYGKDYLMLNSARSSAESEPAEWMMLGGLLAFYEQCLVYTKNKAGLAAYNIERPLWLFVGNSVTGGNKKTSDTAALTDVETVVDFISDFLSQPDKYKPMLERLLGNETGIKDDQGQEPFRNHFRYLRTQPQAYSGRSVPATGKWDDLYKNIVQYVFLGELGEKLRVVELKNAQGEIGLRVGTERPYFGVINVGDSTRLLEILTTSRSNQGYQLLADEDHLSSSLFAKLGNAGSKVTMLIGSRKFIEGWDNFRVSSLGLMNLGKDEGSQIIQLFGRGVRLRGLGNSLKRSTMLGYSVSAQNTAPPYIELLETLNIVGIKADYMQGFLANLENEGVETDLETMFIPVRVTNANFLKQGLLIIGQTGSQNDNHADFNKSGEAVIVKSAPISPEVKLVIDNRVSVNSVGSVDVSLMDDHVINTENKDRSDILKSILNWLDWDSIYFELLAWKRRKAYTNLVFTRQTLIELLKELKYTLYCPEGYLPPASMGEIKKVEGLVHILLSKYMDTVYTRAYSSWQKGRVSLVLLDNAHPDFLADGGVITDDAQTKGKYVVGVRRAFAEEVRKLLAQGDALYKNNTSKLNGLPTIHFDRHLYQPLLVDYAGGAHSAQGIERCAPPLLNKGEEKFVEDLRTFLTQRTLPPFVLDMEDAHDKPAVNQAPPVQNVEFFLLRNLSKVGVGFYDPQRGSHVYPDFILWILGKVAGEQHQWITFIDPHGLVYAGNFNDPKIRLYSELQSLEADLQPTTGQGQSALKVHLNSFVIHPNHTTIKDYEALKNTFGTGKQEKGDFLANNVLFQADSNYIAVLVQQILSRRLISPKGIAQVLPSVRHTYRTEVSPPE